MLRGSQETNKSHPKRTCAKKCPKLSPEKDSENTSLDFGGGSIEIIKPPPFTKKTSNKQTTPRTEEFRLNCPQPHPLACFLTGLVHVVFVC